MIKCKLFRQSADICAAQSGHGGLLRKIAPAQDKSGPAHKKYLVLTDEIIT